MKSYTDLEQSKKLAEILPLESADMFYVHTTDLEGDEHYDIDFRINQPLFEDDVCAWSLAALLSVLPDVSLNTFKDGKWNAMVQHDGKMIYVDKDNPVDACYEMILKLHEQELL